MINGGIINAYGTNTRLGEGDWMVVEADESDGTLPAPAGRSIAVVTNIDPEHLDHWGTLEAMNAGYDQFVAQHAVLRLRRAVHRSPGGAGDDPAPVATAASSPTASRRRPTCAPSGWSTDKLGSTFEVVVTDRARNRARRMGPFRLPMLGQHNVQNALAAIAVGVEMEIDDDDAAQRASPASAASSAASPRPARPAASR